MKQRFIVYIDCNPTVSYKNLAYVLESVIEDNLVGAYFREESVKVNKYKEIRHMKNSKKEIKTLEVEKWGEQQKFKDKVANIKTETLYISQKRSTQMFIARHKVTGFYIAYDLVYSKLVWISDKDKALIWQTEQDIKDTARHMGENIADVEAVKL